MRTTKKDRTLWNLNKAVMALQKDDNSWELLRRAVDAGLYELAKDHKIAFYEAVIIEWPEEYKEKKPIFVLSYIEDFDKAKSEDDRDAHYGIKPYHIRTLLASIHINSMRHEFR